MITVVKFILLAGAIVAAGSYAAVHSNFLMYIFAGVGIGQIAIDVAKFFID